MRGKQSAKRIRQAVAGLLIGALALAEPMGMVCQAQDGVVAQNMVLQYDFDAVSGNTVPDISGNGVDGTLVGTGAGIGTGKTGDAVILNQNGKNDSYVQLQPNIVADLKDYTITAWVRVDEYRSWERVFDFGKDSNTYMFFSPCNSNEGGSMTFAISNGSSGGEEKIQMKTKFELNRWTHLGITQKGGKVTLYVDGEEAASSNFTKNPKDTIGKCVNNYLGKSQYADPYFSGAIDDFRIYNEALDHFDILDIRAESEKKIQSVEPLVLHTKLGEQPELPENVEVTYADGTMGQVPVAWPEITEEMLYAKKDYEVTGALGGKTVTATIHTDSDSLRDDMGITAEVSHVLAKPREITASYKIANYSESDQAVVLYYEVYDRSTDKVIQTNKEAKRTVNAKGFLKEEIKFEIPEGYDPYKTEMEIRAYVLDGNGSKISNECKYVPESIVKGSMFEDDAVKLEEGMFKEAQELNQELFLTYDVDRLCAPLFDATEAGTGRKKERYGGWEHRDIAGVSIGHYMTTAALMYKQTGNEIFKERLDYAVSEVRRAQLQNGTGFVGGYGKVFEGVQYKSAEDRFIKNVFDKPDSFRVDPYSLGGIWDCWYSIQKIFKGALEAYMLTGNETGLQIAEDFAKWTKEQTDKLNFEQMQRMLFSEYGGMAETLVWLYQVTGKDEYMTLAERFVRRTTQMDYLAREEDDLDGRHANEQMPEVTGAAAYYTVSGDEYMKRGTEFFWKTVTENRTYANGGNSNHEHFPPFGTEPLSRFTTETCNTFNFLKLTEYLYSWNHDSAYMDYFEYALYNHILTTQDPLTGQKVYFTPLVPGGFRIYSTTEDSWWCCNLSGMENPARFNKMIYYKDRDDLYVNLFIPSSVKWKEKGMQFTQKTDFPNNDTITLQVTEGSGAANIKFRMPNWAAGDATVWVNGEKVDVAPQDGYLTISGDWKTGDEISVQYPMAVGLYQKRDDKNSVAVKYGPILLAAPLGRENYPANDYVNDQGAYGGDPGLNVPSLVTDSKDPKEWVTRTNNEELVFETTAIGRPGYESMKLVPFYSIHHERYNVYWNLYTAQEYKELRPGVKNVSITDDFTDSNYLNRYQVMGNDWNANVSNGELNFSSKDGDKIVMKDVDMADGVYQMDVTIKGGGGNAGIAFRASNYTVSSDGLDGYYVGIGDRYVHIGKMNQSWMELRRVDMPELKVGTTHTLKVTAFGSRIQVYIDDAKEPCINLTDSTYKEGGVAIRGFSISAAVDNIKISSVPNYKTDFADNANEWESAGNWTVKNGVYTASENAYSLADSGLIEDLAYAADLALEKDSKAALMIRASEDDKGITGYGLAVDAKANKLQLIKAVRGGITVLAEMDYQAEVGKTARFTVKAEDGSVKAFIGDSKKAVLSAKDADFTSGQIGVWNMAGASSIDNVTAGAPFEDESEPGSLEEAIKKAQAAQKEAEEARDKALAAKAEAIQKAEAAQAAQRAAETARAEAEKMANASREEKEAAEAKAQEAEKKAQEAREQADAADAAAKLAEASQKAAEDAAAKAAEETEILKQELNAAKEELEKAKEETLKAQEEANRAKAEAEAAAKAAEEALAALKNQNNSGSQTQTPAEPIKRGDTWSDGKLNYKVTSADAKTVTVTGTVRAGATSITIPATVKIKGTVCKITAIDKNAFKGNKKLKKATIGKNVKAIGSKAFYKCGKLKKVTVKATGLTAVGKGAFKGIAKKAVVKVPRKKVTVYKKLLKKAGLPRTVKVK